MGQVFANVGLGYWYLPGMNYEDRKTYEAERVKRLNRHRAMIKRTHGKPVSPRLYRKLLRLNCSYYHELPSEWRRDPECLRYYVKRVLDVRVTRRQGPYAAMLSFMSDEDVGFGGNSVLLEEHGDAFYACDASALIKTLLSDCKKAGIDTSSLISLGRWFIKWSREQEKPATVGPGVSLTGLSARKTYVEHCVRLSFIFKHYPLSEFVPAIEELSDWECFIKFYGKEGVGAFPSGRRYLLEQDMGL